ncbi:rho GTPase-activating protein 12-like isoform X1 [Schistocerca gregaria]|uniref:rho GTPase-activating protein 12-like isoform X1 n=1 Tax=Schistocerca gregaria TaxID=7010 RepID=UPI00211DE705|nr:rho GTPase-activating protein 12-like isoform X1 [Schistocerca gregaria]
MDFRDVHLRVLYSFNYETKGGRKISINEGEKLFLIRKTNADWWQVIRNSSERPFFVPASYVEEIKYDENKKDSSKSHGCTSKKRGVGPHTVSDNAGVLNDMDMLEATVSVAHTKKTFDKPMSYKQQAVHNELSSLNKRISSEKWRLWAAEELVSELASTASLHSVESTTYSNETFQRMTSEQPNLQTELDSCSDPLSLTDKGSGCDHKANIPAASCSEQLSVPNKKGSIQSFSSATSGGKLQAELLRATTEKPLSNKLICDTKKFEDSCKSKNAEKRVALCKTDSKDIAVIPEKQAAALLSSTKSSRSLGEKLCGSYVEFENHSYNPGDIVGGFKGPDQCSVHTDMFSKMKSKLKYSASFKTKRELQKLSEKREGNSVLSSSWDKLEAAGQSTNDILTNVDNGISSSAGNLKCSVVEKKSSVSEGSHNNCAPIPDLQNSGQCKAEENSLQPVSECDWNANYTAVVKEKVSTEEHQECERQVDILTSESHSVSKDSSDSEQSKVLVDSSGGTLKSQKISSSCESIEDWREEDTVLEPECALDVVNIPLPDGWIESYDEQLDLPCYIHEKSGEKWFSSNDAEGRVYFYQENSSESSWRLPEVPSTMLEVVPPATPSSKETSKEKEKPTVIISSDDSQIRHQIEDEIRPTFRMTKARSMLLTDTKSRETTTKSSSVPRNYLPIWDGVVHTLKEGTLNKTKMWEIGGKKVRKNWSPSYVVLSKFHLLFFKDIKAYNAVKLAVSPGSASSSPDLCIDLKGALVEEAEKLSSRKYVFAITTVQGLKVLLQCDDKSLYTDWYHAVRNAIRSITKESGLRNSSSTKDVGSFLNQAVSPNQNRKVPRIDRSRSVKNKNKEGSLEDLASSPEDQQIGIHTRLKNFFLRRPLKEALEQRGILKNEAVFGCHLPDVCNEEPFIPLFVRKCVEVIESKDENMKTVGLYRASGNLSQVQKIRLQVNQDNYKALEEEEDVHVLTGALKLFFRELKEPLIPCKMFSKALDASSKSQEEEKLKDFQDIVKSLPKPNRCTLKFLLQHLLRVTEYKADNQMSIHTLAIVFGPSLMWPEEESQNIAFDFMMQNVVIEFLLKAFHNIFGDSCNVSA